MDEFPPHNDRPDEQRSERGETFMIFERLAVGDPRAMDDFFRRYRRWMLELAQLRTGAYLLSRVEHDDLAQKALLDLWSYREMFVPGREAEVRAIAARIVDSKIRDEARRWKARKRSDHGEVAAGPDDAAIGVGSNDPSPSLIATRDEFREKLATCLARLPEDHRRVLVLRLRHQLSLEAAAKELGRTTDATAMLESRARRMLRDLMRGGDDSSSVIEP